MRKVILLITILISLQSCNTKSITVLVISATEGVEIDNKEKKFDLVKKSEDFLQKEYYFKVENLTDTSINIKSKGKTLNYKINKSGLFIVNLTDEVVIAKREFYKFKSPFELQNNYNSKMFTENNPALKKLLDSLENKSNQEFLEANRKDPYKSILLSNIYPNTISRLTLGNDYRIFGINDNAPEEIFVKKNDVIPLYYQMLTLKGYLNYLQNDKSDENRFSKTIRYN